METDMPPANRARERLVAAIRELDVVKRRKVKNSSTYLLYYAYSLSIKDLIDQLDRIGLLLRQLFGVLGGSPDEFEGRLSSCLTSLSVYISLSDA